jgi:hypothetical protein
LTHPEAKLTIIKTLRLNGTLMQEINDECEARNLEFSNFMRNAARAAIRRQDKLHSFPAQ